MARGLHARDYHEQEPVGDKKPHLIWGSVAGLRSLQARSLALSSCDPPGRAGWGAHADAIRKDAPTPPPRFLAPLAKLQAPYRQPSPLLRAHPSQWTWQEFAL